MGDGRAWWPEHITDLCCREFRPDQRCVSSATRATLGRVSHTGLWLCYFENPFTWRPVKQRFSKETLDSGGPASVGLEAPGGLPAASYICPLLSDRCGLHHNHDLPVEGVSHHRGQLPATLHPQVLEAQAVPAQLLQADLLGASSPAPRVLVGAARLWLLGGTGEDGRDGSPRAALQCSIVQGAPLLSFYYFSEFNFLTQTSFSFY